MARGMSCFAERGASCPTRTARQELTRRRASSMTAAEAAEDTLLVVGLLAAVGAVAMYMYFRPELLRYLQMRRM